MLDLHRLRTLQAVARHGSVSAAAEALYLTASAVSQQLGKLEREVGQQLLEPQGRGIRLTAAAELLVGHTARILSLVEEAEADLEAKRGVVHGSLTVGAFATAARDLIPPTLRALRISYPALRLSLRETEPDQALLSVGRGDLDVAIVVSWSNSLLAIPEQLSREHLFDDQADLALPVDHPLASRTSVDLEELTDQDWISWSRGSICRDWLVQTLRHLGTEPRIAHTAMEHATQLALVGAGLGAAIIPRLGRGSIPNTVRLLRIRSPLVRPIFAVWPKGSTRRPAVAALLEALREQVAVS
ncbi:MAG: LysR family transcriptional regulator [Deltaproteobacteria bacterium]|nr:LysR family transcriptional regulator [Deltaproteobacteria bacterium]